MLILPHFCIVLCLVVDINARSAKSIHEEPDAEVLSPLQIEDAENQAVDFCNPNPCKNGGDCLKYSEKCACKARFSGVFCEKCKCENGFCKEDDEGGSVCACPTEWGLHSPTTCKKCDCGKDSNCTFDVGIFSETKTCLCKEGYEDKKGFCEGTCTTNPCLNRGRCLVKGNDIECSCKEPFWGELCEMYGTPCDSSPCKNGGTCEWNESHSYTCTCTERYEGEHCEKGRCLEEEIEDCGDAKCAYNKSLERAVCDCGEGRKFDPITKTCKDTCSMIFCENNGTCRLHNGTAECHCLERFSGKFCEIDVCSPNPCRNGGVCNATKGRVTCQCKDHFIGADCSLDVCSPNPCRNGGVCNATKGRVVCRCKDHFVGADCSVEISFPSTRTSATTVNSTGFSTHHTTVSKTNITTPRFNFSTIVPDLTTKYSTKGHLFNFTGETTSTVLPPTLAPTTGTDLCAWNPCKNGGMCVIENGSMKCFCKEPFTGEFCESRIKYDAYVIILVAISVFLSIVLIFVSCVLCQRYRVMKS